MGRPAQVFLVKTGMPGQHRDSIQPTRSEKMPAEERVLCFKRELLDQLGAFQGLSLDVDRYFSVLTSLRNLTYLNRGDAEQNRRYKQLIPYVLVLCGGKVLRYRRGKGGGESRLHGLFSVGVGGHISEEDSGLFSNDRGYLDGMRRELMEEVAIGDVKDAAVALINDDSTDVGAVHFGVVHVVVVPDESVAGRRSGIVGPEFVPIADAVNNLDGYESWSRFCLENIETLIARAGSAGIIDTAKAGV